MSRVHPADAYPDRNVYLDNNATTRVDEQVAAAMLPCLTEMYGNPSSRHQAGRRARAAIDAAREQVAAAVGAHSSQVVFVSGGTEANNLAIKGMAAMRAPAKMLVSEIEHPSVRQPAAELLQRGWQVQTMVVDAAGRVDVERAASQLDAHTGLATLMLANNETGVLQDVARLAERVRAVKGWMHSDGVQVLGKLPLDFASLGVHALTLSGHKIYGPKGVGALVYDKRVEFAPLLTGGGHEKGLRAGTENVPAIVGFGLACELAVQRLQAVTKSLPQWRDRLAAEVVSLGGSVFGAAAERLPNTVFFAFAGIEGETLVMELDRLGFAIASGSACSSGKTEPSPVLLAMGVEPGLARGAVRVSLGRETREQDVTGFVQALAGVLQQLRQMAASVSG